MLRYCRFRLFANKIFILKNYVTEGARRVRAAGHPDLSLTPIIFLNYGDGPMNVYRIICVFDEKRHQIQGNPL